MAEQLSFAALDAKPTDRLFFAVFVAPDAARRVQALQHEMQTLHRLQGKPVAVDRLHVTLAHLGDYAGLPNDLLAQAMSAGDAMKGAAFDVAFNRVGSFGGRPRNKPLVLQGEAGVAGVIDLQASLHVEMRKVGLAKWARPYTPHVTLLYDNAEIAQQPIEPVTWRVTEFALVHSLLGKTQHNVCGRWSLAG
jgi:2'-5' RNA ligase